MRIIKVFLVLLIAMGISQTMYAQRRTAKKAVTAPQKTKPPKLQTMLGIYKDSVSVPAAEVEALIALPLKIYDDKKNEYMISSYQFLYRKKGVTEDEATGKVTPASSISSSLFKTSPLPELWINIIREEVKPGEELYFFDVIAKNAQGRVMYAPDLKITVR